MSRLELLGGLVGLVAGIVPLVGAGRAVARRVDGQPGDRLLAGLVVAAATLTVALVACGAARVLAPWPALGAVVVASTIVAAAAGLTGPARPARLVGERGLSAWWWWLASPLVGSYVLRAVDRPVTDPDALRYHLPNLAGWLEAQSLWDTPERLPGISYRGFPGGHELLLGGSILPFRADLLVGLTQIALTGIALLAVARFARDVGVRPRAADAAALATGLAPYALATQWGTAHLDLWEGGMFCAAALFAVRATRDGGRALDAALAGAAYGLAAGAKPTALVQAAVALLVVAVARLAARRRPSGAGWRRVAIGVGVAAAVGGFWYLRNAVELHNPLYPASLGPLPGADQYLLSTDSSLARAIADLDPGFWSRYADAAARTLGLTWVAAAAGLVVAIRRGGVVGAVAVGLVVALLVSPYGAGTADQQPLLLLGSNRYALPTVAVGLVGLAAAIGNRAWPLLVVAVLGIPLWPRIPVTEAVDGRLVAVAASLAVVGAGIAVARVVVARRWPAARSAVTVVAGLLAVVVAAAGLERARVRITGPDRWATSQGAIGAAWDRLAAADPPLRTGQAGDERVYPLFGPRLDRAPVPFVVDPGGRRPRSPQTPAELDALLTRGRVDRLLVTPARLPYDGVRFRALLAGSPRLAAEPAAAGAPAVVYAVRP